MQCVVHVRKSFDFCGDHFVLRLFPHSAPGERRSESFTSVGAMLNRLLELGVSSEYVKVEFARLGGMCDAVWTNIETPRAMFESFGGAGGHGSVAA
jgi:hypothetical protein